MAQLTVRTTRPLSTSSEVVLRPEGELDAGTEDALREAIAFVVSRAGGPIVLDCAALTAVGDESVGTLEWFADEARTSGRVAVLRHVTPAVQQVLERTGSRERFDALA